MKDVGRTVRSKLTAKWHQNREANGHSNFKMFKRTPGPWSANIALTCRQQVVLNRLRIGHTRLAHSYLFTGSARPTCPACTAPLEIHHLLECPNLTLQRDIYTFRAVVSIWSAYFQNLQCANIPKNEVTIVSERFLAPEYSGNTGFYQKPL